VGRGRLREAYGFSKPGIACEIRTRVVGSRSDRRESFFPLRPPSEHRDSLDVYFGACSALIPAYVSNVTSETYRGLSVFAAHPGCE